MFNTIQQISKTYKERLKSVYNENEIRSFVSILALHELGYTRVDCMMKDTVELTEADSSFFQIALNKLSENIPIQQIIGETEFYGLPFKVTRDVLIPRPETEELVQWILKDNTGTTINILDIGSGSGCIPITIKQYLPKAKVSSWDVSEAALSVANENLDQPAVMICRQFILITRSKIMIWMEMEKNLTKQLNSDIQLSLRLTPPQYFSTLCSP